MGKGAVVQFGFRSRSVTREILRYARKTATLRMTKSCNFRCLLSSKSGEVLAMYLPRIACFLILLVLPVVAQREQFQNAEVTYDWVTNHERAEVAHLCYSSHDGCGQGPGHIFCRVA